MTRNRFPRFLSGPLAATSLLALGACSSGGADSSQPSSRAEATAELSSSLASAETPSCSWTTAGGGWFNSFIPQANELLTFWIDGLPAPQGNPSPPTIDAVIGLSNGPADAFSDLGPIVRFSPSGYIDARDGDQYVGAFPYTTGSAPWEISLEVNITSHLYNVWVRHLDSPGKPFELLGSALKFRSEQSSVTRLDNLARFVDGSQGRLQTCNFRYAKPEQCTVTGPSSWASQAFPSQASVFRLEFDVLPAANPTGAPIDAVIGASLGAPTAFSSLGPIVRFNSNGRLDARNGSTYEAANQIPYQSHMYHFAMDINRATHTYSVTVADLELRTPALLLASNYRFRTEQASVTSLDHLGQFMDGTPGQLYVCSLIVEY